MSERAGALAILQTNAPPHSLTHTHTAARIHAHLLERQAVRDDDRRVERALEDLVAQHAPRALHRRLAAAQLQLLLHERAEVEAVRDAGVRARERHAAALAHRAQARVDDLGRVALDRQRGHRAVQQARGVVHADGVDDDVRRAAGLVGKEATVLVGGVG